MARPKLRVVPALGRTQSQINANSQKVKYMANIQGTGATILGSGAVVTTAKKIRGRRV